MWPVHGVIGENGGLYFRYSEGKMQRYFAYSAEEREEFRLRLERIREQVLADVPGCAIATDQPYREFDLAVDYAEDVAPLSVADAERIREIFARHGATAKVSSIHVNGWFGEFDKLTTSKRYISRELGLSPEADKDRIVFIGDSPNDEPMFCYFPQSVGVSNIRRFSKRLKRLPTYITEEAGGAGFAEAVEAILQRGEKPKSPHFLWPRI
jgi:hydroxymethylpyrimidine pyrophosphatase-like HAD family hydrolase